MHIKYKFLFFGLLTLLLVARCRTKSNSDKSIKNKNTNQTKAFKAKKLDSIIEQLNNHSELTKDDLLEIKVFDSTQANSLSETGYCDTTIQINDSIFYSIININDNVGLCLQYYISTFNNKSKKLITSKYLYADCDVDFASDTYEVYNHKIISNDKIQLTKTTVFQKKNRTSPDEEENIDHEQTEKSYLLISQNGQINNNVK